MANIRNSSSNLGFRFRFCIVIFACAVVLALNFRCYGEINLLDRYPTPLTSGDASPERARSWEFGEADVFRLSEFKFSAGADNAITIELGEAAVGIGHCKDGAVWAVIVPTSAGKLGSSQAPQPQAVAHIWLRFHPSQIADLFPATTVSSNNSSATVFQMRAVANAKMRSSWQAGGRAMIPEPKDLTLDVDTRDGVRRFFVIDRQANTVEYVRGFERQPVRMPGPINAELAEQAFDQLWEAFDREYAMFVLRPEVDWARLRDEYRPRALASKSAFEFAGQCAAMLRHLRDLHVWVTVAGTDVSVFNRERIGNANPAAFQSLLGEVKTTGPIQWSITKDKVGFIAVYGWNGLAVVQNFDEVLEQMRDTAGLVFDVRLNGGGSEDIAREVAGRFLEKEFVYAYSQFRNGPTHTNLTEKFERRIKPRGPWRYHRPVILLIGQKCMSSNESFIAMMSGAPQVTIMGDHTCGSSGNPKTVKLPLDMTVSVPRWIDYLPDGTPLDEKGFAPREKFAPGEGAFEGKRDDLLSAALEKLRAQMKSSAGGKP